MSRSAVWQTPPASPLAPSLTDGLTLLNVLRFRMFCTSIWYSTWSLMVRVAGMHTPVISTSSGSSSSGAAISATCSSARLSWVRKSIKMPDDAISGTETSFCSIASSSTRRSSMNACRNEYVGGGRVVGGRSAGGGERDEWWVPGRRFGDDSPKATAA